MEPNLRFGQLRESSRGMVCWTIPTSYRGVMSDSREQSLSEIRVLPGRLRNPHIADESNPVAKHGLPTKKPPPKQQPTTLTPAAQTKGIDDESDDDDEGDQDAKSNEESTDNESFGRG